jgi:hypothetical protein
MKEKKLHTASVPYNYEFIIDLIFKKLVEPLFPCFLKIPT